MKYEITKNEAYKSFEITFDGKPSEAVREALKTLKYRWHGVKKVWYGYGTEEAVREAIAKAENGETVKAPKVVTPKPEKVNKYGVKLFDIFEMWWGYDQTNVDFFQVVELVGESSVRIKQVHLPMVHENAYAPMAADRTYEVKREAMPASSYSVHVKDNNGKGDLKRVLKSGNTIYLNMASYANAYLLQPGKTTTSESWYH